MSQTTVGALEARGHTKRFPGVLANDDVSLQVHRGEILALLGEHGATTFFQVVWPPFDRGMTWSKVRLSWPPQYLQVKRSRRNTLNRVNAGGRS